ncbi:hypothetical protein AAIR98_000190 [Elusimicrobium simillimum]|uniref:hypothetical protein n=1 Tax=Elusimicrobium simillimum TaxID=3143438 RepID=UPI003C6F1712
MNSDTQQKMIYGIGILLLFLLIALPVSYAVKKAKNIDSAIDPVIIEGLKVNVDVRKPSSGGVITGDIIGSGLRGVEYVDTGSAIVIPVRSNINTFVEKDFKLIGTAPWALLNTVHTNLDDAAVIRFVFNTVAVNDAFMARKDVNALLQDPKALYAVALDEAALQKFFNYTAVKAALANPKVVETIAASRIMDSVLRSPAVQYFIKNPKSTAATINKSPTLSALKNNPAIANALKTNKHTKNVASIILK